MKESGIMEIKFKKEQVKNSLEEYYKKIEGFNGVITTKCSRDWFGYGMSEREDVRVEITLNGSFDFMGEKILMSRTLSEAEVNGVFKSLLSEAGYTVQYVSFDKGVTPTTEGYGLGEHTVNKPYFNGIIAKVAVKQLVK